MSVAVHRTVARGVVMPVADAMRQIVITVRVTGIRRMRARFWLASWIFRLGALVAGCNVNVEGEE